MQAGCVSYEFHFRIVRVGFYFKGILRLVPRTIHLRRPKWLDQALVNKVKLHLTSPSHQGKPCRDTRMTGSPDFTITHGRAGSRAQNLYTGKLTISKCDKELSPWQGTPTVSA